MKNILFLLIIFYSLNTQSQEDQEGDPPIIFGEFLLGGAGRINGNAGIVIGGELNYQYKKSLFSVRYIENSQWKLDVLLFTPVTPIPTLEEKHSNKELGLLYGIRWIYGGSSLSISGGISRNTYSSKLAEESGSGFMRQENYVGFPFEVNFKWFKSEKKKYRILFGLISVGKPTPFGGNFGFKLLGNISRNSFIGLGVVYGLGIHKKY